MDPSALDGLGFLFVFLVLGLIYIGYPILSIMIGALLKRKLTSNGYGSRISWTMGVVIAFTLLAIPFIDYPYKRYLLKEYYSQDGGFHISRVVTGVAGIHGLRYACDYGYQYGEEYLGTSKEKSLWRYRKAPQGNNRGKYLEEKNVNPSPYGFRKIRTQKESSIYRVDLQTYVTSTGEELGRYVYYENVPDKDSSISINSFRIWMRMSYPNMKSGYYMHLRELLNKTLIPS
ncbi:MAG: hypothetical protein M0023_08670 [Desulfobacteraceae bacterium]|nr:hypothetical protein [Desulfobacteraceae bacterium]